MMHVPGDMSDASREIAIYTDGACCPNPGRGGYGVILAGHEQRREISGGFLKTTNNRMELFSVIAGLRALDMEHMNVTVFSDSRYVVDMYMCGHARRWKANGWRRGNAPALNSDLWAQLIALCDKHEVKFVWIKGHSEHPENCRCDELAVEARLRENLPLDDCYAPPAVMQQLSLF
jgi:ribonuclease HI